MPLPDPFRRVISATRGCRHAGDGLVIDGCPSCARRNWPERMARVSDYRPLAGELIEPDDDAELVAA